MPLPCSAGTFTTPVQGRAPPRCTGRAAYWGQHCAAAVTARRPFPRLFLHTTRAALCSSTYLPSNLYGWNGLSIATADSIILRWLRGELVACCGGRTWRHGAGAPSFGDASRHYSLTKYGRTGRV